MRKRPRSRPPTATSGQRRQRQRDYIDPRWLRGDGRSGRIPRTLIDASTVANAATGLRTFAAAIDTDRPCWAQTMRRYAEQIANGYSEAAAVAAMTTVPSASASFTEGAFAEGAFAEGAFVENPVPIEPAV